ncbi:hypothetical protein BH11ARM2_BH11ARM2_05230 [soil metagenome]
MLFAPLLLLQTPTQTPAMTAPPEVSVFVNDQAVTMDAKPVIRHGRVLVPIRAVTEAMGGTVTFYPGRSMIFLERDIYSVEMPIGGVNITANNKPAMIDQPPLVIKGRTMVPLRFVGEFLGAGVTWDSETRRVDVRTPDKPNKGTEPVEKGS